MIPVGKQNVFLRDLSMSSPEELSRTCREIVIETAYMISRDTSARVSDSGWSPIRSRFLVGDEPLGIRSESRTPAG